MPELGIRSTYSQSPFQILINDDNGLISTGSAFFYDFEEENFLITNWHNVSGKHFLTDEKLDKTSDRLPTNIEAKLATNIGGTNGFTTIAHKIEIYEDYNPIWFEHPVLGSKCDVIAIPIARNKNLADNFHYPSNLISQIRIPVKPGNTAFVIGFPKSISVYIGLPIWKSGYIASEPFYNVTIGGKVSKLGGLELGLDLPAFFIDTQTKEGMSGSPVFANYIGNWDMTNPYEPIDPDAKDFNSRNNIAIGENRLEFIGCYSGRIGKQEEGATLGLCWRKDVIDLICKTRKIGEHPHVGKINE
jgi:hypothetical protein